MNLESLQQIKQKAEELIKYHEQTNRLDLFIERIREDRYLDLKTCNQYSMWNDERDTFDFIGAEIIELLERKLEERRQHIEKIEVADLNEIP